MAEVGLVLFAHTALEVINEILSAYCSKFSKYTFTQPQLMTILCLMRFKDWSFREAEIRLSEHSDLRAALGLQQVPDHTTLYCFMRRVTDEMTCCWPLLSDCPTDTAVARQEGDHCR